MSTAIIVYQSTPMIGTSTLPSRNILGMFRQNKLVTKPRTRKEK